MLQLLILLAFAYAQDNHGTYPAYAWAVAYSVLSMHDGDVWWSADGSDGVWNDINGLCVGVFCCVAASG